jgi:hypothetical protein
VQVHSHPGAAFHSGTDDTWPAVRLRGYLSLVIPYFATGEPDLGGAYLAEQDENGSWLEGYVREKNQNRARTSSLPGIMSALDASHAEALDRTLALMRDHIGDVASDGELLAELSRCKVVVVADCANAASRQGQVALITAALLCARTGADVCIVADEVPLVGLHPPLRGSRLLEGLVEVGGDLIPGSAIKIGEQASRGRADLCVLIGDTPRPQRIGAELTVRTCGDTWSGSLLPANEVGESWVRVHGPFGAMTSAALVAAEAYKLVMRRLRNASKVSSDVFDMMFGPSPRAAVRLAALDMSGPSELGEVDFISGGAVTHAALYALSRIEGVTATGRVIEPEIYDLPNLNRYTLMRRSDVTLGKARHLADLDLGGIRLEPIARRYDETLQRTLGKLADSVLVGVDHIPSRWTAQAHARDWLGVGGTEHYDTMVSFHDDGTPCAACLHHSDGEIDPRAPTVAFVSFWAGLWLAALYVRHKIGQQPTLAEQVVLTTMLRPDLGYAVATMPVPRRSDCRLSCDGTSAAEAVHQP